MNYISQNPKVTNNLYMDDILSATGYESESYRPLFYRSANMSAYNHLTKDQFTLLGLFCKCF